MVADFVERKKISSQIFTWGTLAQGSLSGYSTPRFDIVIAVTSVEWFFYFDGFLASFLPISYV